MSDSLSASIVPLENLERSERIGVMFHNSRRFLVTRPRHSPRPIRVFLAGRRIIKRLSSCRAQRFGELPLSLPSRIIPDYLWQIRMKRHPSQATKVSSGNSAARRVVLMKGLRHSIGLMVGCVLSSSTCPTCS
jgi:hypothetical protein